MKNSKPFSYLESIHVCLLAGLIFVLGCKTSGTVFLNDPPISTSIQDAISDIPFLDRYDPEYFRPMASLLRGKNNGFLIKHPGDYAFFSQSYCLHAGTYSPTSGDGYLYAPLKGPFSDIIKNILQKSVQHPEIPQRDIQELIWAIIARSKLKSTSPRVQFAMIKLLTPEEILKINGGAIGLIPEQLKSAVFNRLPSEVQHIVETEAEMRSLLQEANTTYEELEALAVRTGVAPWGKDSREVPEGRWSYHPDGYFLRYYPEDYSTVQVQLSYPGKVTIEKDSLQRITLIQDNQGNQIRVKYNNSQTPLVVKKLKGYTFQTIQFIRAARIPPETIIFFDAAWNNSGWSFQGMPDKDSKVEQTNSAYNGAAERINIMKEHLLSLKKLSSVLNTDSDLTLLLDLAHLELGIRNLLSESSQTNESWVYTHLNLLYQAWQATFVEWARKGAINTEMEYPSFGNTAVPGNTSKQRLEISGRVKDKPEEDLCKRLSLLVEWQETMIEAWKNDVLANRCSKQGCSGHEYQNAVAELANKNFKNTIKGTGMEYIPKKDSRWTTKIVGYVENDAPILISEYDTETWVEKFHPDNFQKLIDFIATEYFNGNRAAAQIEAESSLEHERMHADQDKNGKMKGDNPVATKRRNEIPAYETSKAILTEGLLKLGCQ